MFFLQSGQLFLVVVVFVFSCKFSETWFLRLLRLLDEVLRAAEVVVVVVLGLVLVSVGVGTLVAGVCPLQLQSPFRRGFLWHTTMCVVLLVETRKKHVCSKGRFCSMHPRGPCGMPSKML